jgi:hypothetical protein
MSGFWDDVDVDVDGDAIEIERRHGNYYVDKA